MANLTADVTVKKHLRPGHIVPVQTGADDDHQPNSTASLLTLPVDLIINRDYKKQAIGRLFLDDGLTHHDIINKTYEYYEFQMVN
jgi:hypothetical protein